MGYPIIEWLERRGTLNRTVRYALSDRVTVELPLWRRPNQLGPPEARNYERHLIQAVCGELRSIGLPALLVDCGADVGLASALLVAHAELIHEVVACEPNAEPRELLALNLASWPVAARCLPYAIADFHGRGRLAQPTYDTSPHAAFLEADPGGDVEVRRIDDLELDVAGRCLVLKIDVEGGEPAVLRGAMATLKRAAAWIVTLEAHRKVANRTGVDPCEIARLLPDAGMTKCRVAERPEPRLDLARPYFDQVTDLPIGNLVCVGHG